MNPGMPEHRIAAAPGELVTMRTVDVRYLFGTKAYGTVSLDVFDPVTGMLSLSCLIGDSVAVSATAVGNSTAYFAGRFSGDELVLCDGSVLSSVGSGLTENHFLLAWDLVSDEILWSRNLSLTHPAGQDLPSLALDPEGRLWYYMRDFTDARVVRVDDHGSDVETRWMTGVRNLGTLSFDPWGGLYASGSCENGLLSFGGQDFPVSSTEGYNMFVLRFRPDGTAGFAAFAQDITFQDPTVAATMDGHAYLAGSIFTGTTWGDHSVNAPNWGSGVFITRLDSTGLFEWILGSQEEPGVIAGDIGRADGPCIAVNASGTVHFLGVCRGSVDWGHGVASGSTGNMDRMLTLLTVAPSGTPLWAITSEAATMAIEPQGIAITGDDSSVHFATHVADPLSIDGLSSGEAGLQSAVIGRVDGLSTAVPELVAPPLMTAWPVPASDRLSVFSHGNRTMGADIHHATGPIVRTTELHPGLNVLDVRNLASGVYLLRTRTGSCVRFVVE